MSTAVFKRSNSINQSEPDIIIIFAFVFGLMEIVYLFETKCIVTSRSAAIRPRIDDNSATIWLILQLRLLKMVQSSTQSLYIEVIRRSGAPETCCFSKLLMWSKEIIQSRRSWFSLKSLNSRKRFFFQLLGKTAIQHISGRLYSVRLVATFSVTDDIIWGGLMFFFLHGL